MIIRKIELKATSFNAKQLLTDELPKIVFSGRSNVGKSSLINKLLNRKSLAKTSSKPGKTVSVNYYLINDFFYFVDLPGYGYAKIARSESRRVVSLIDSFFAATHNIRAIFQLIDSRRGFMESDLEILSKIIEREYNILTVLTKSDKLSKSRINSLVGEFNKKYDLNPLPFSVKSDVYKEKILTTIDSILEV